MNLIFYIFLIFSLTLKAQTIQDFTDEVHRVMVVNNEGFSIGNGCGVDNFTVGMVKGNYDMNFNTLEIMNNKFVVTGNIINEGVFIYVCDTSVLEIRGGTLSVQEQTKETLKIYPNPASNEINIKGIQVSEIELYDMTGRRIKHYQTFGQLHRIMIDDLEAGIYILVINGHIRHKFVKL